MTHAVLTYVGDKILALVVNTPTDDLSPSEQIKLLATAQRKLIETEPDVQKVFMNWSVTFAENVRPLFISYQTMLIDELAERMPQTGDSRSLARILLAMAEALGKMTFDNVDPATMEKFVEWIETALE